MEQKIEWLGWTAGKCIGKGAHGVVYEITREVFGDVERKALKIIRIPSDPAEVESLRSSGMKDEDITQSLFSQVSEIIKEYKLMRRLADNPNIVHCDDFRYKRHTEDLGWDVQIQMELLIPLMKVLDRVETDEQIIRLGLAICNALADCQREKIIHRDIKPQNIFLSTKGEFKLGDFGIAKIVAQSVDQHSIAGTPAYMAPEVYKGEQYGQTVDLYSLGLVLYWLLNERRDPFLPLPPAAYTPQMRTEARMRRLMGEPLPPPKHGSEWLKAVVLKACAYRPEDRYQTAREMANALGGLAKEEDITVRENTDIHTEMVVPAKAKLPADMPVKTGEKLIYVSVPENVKDGQILRVPGAGRTKAGDLYVTVHREQKEWTGGKWILAAAGILAAVVLAVLLLPGRDSGSGTGTVSTVLPQSQSAVRNEEPWEKNVLMAAPVDTEIPYDGYKSSVSAEPVFRMGYDRIQIKTVTFESTLENAPEECWDVSQTQDGSVLAWVESAGSDVYNEYYHLYLAAEGGINGREACRDLFCGYSNLTQINFNNSFHTEQAEDMSRMFYGCFELEQLDLSQIRTDSAITTSGMFAVCWRLKELDLSTFDTSSVKDMSGMFSGCQSLEQLNLPELETFNVTDVSYMFRSCPLAENLDFSGFDISKVNSYSVFMDEGMVIGGIRWKDFFSERNAAGDIADRERILADAWDSGNVKIAIVNRDFLRIELKEDSLQGKAFLSGRETVSVYLYHSEVKNNAYMIGLTGKDGKLNCEGYYMASGSAANSYHPKNVSWSLEDNGTVIIEVEIGDAMPWSMQEFEKIYVIHYNRDTETAATLSVIDPSGTACAVQFQYILAPDPQYGGETTEKAIIMGLDADRKSIWTHMTDVKTEIAQMAQITEIGYINNAYYYTDGDTLMILDAGTGEVIGKTKGFGANCTDWAVGDNGNLLFTHYYGAGFVETDWKGKILKRVDFGSEYSWATEIDVRGGFAHVRLELGPEPYPRDGYIFRVNLQDYSFERIDNK